MGYTIMYQRGLIDISRRADDLLWSIQPPPDQPLPVRHLMEDPDARLCDHRLGAGDTRCFHLAQHRCHKTTLEATTRAMTCFQRARFRKLRQGFTRPPTHSDCHLVCS